MEARGNRDYIGVSGKQIGVQQSSATLHFGPNIYLDAYPTSTYTINNGKGYNNGFHKYGMLWNDEGVKFSVDGIKFAYIPAGKGFWKRGGFPGDNIWKNATKMAPFDEEVNFEMKSINKQ